MVTSKLYDLGQITHGVFEPSLPPVKSKDSHTCPTYPYCETSMRLRVWEHFWKPQSSEQIRAVVFIWVSLSCGSSGYRSPFRYVSDSCLLFRYLLRVIPDFLTSLIFSSFLPSGPCQNVILGV